MFPAVHVPYFQVPQLITKVDWGQTPTSGNCTCLQAKHREPQHSQQFQKLGGPGGQASPYSGLLQGCELSYSYQMPGCLSANQHT